jgi:hypothetical protein
VYEQRTGEARNKADVQPDSLTSAMSEKNVKEINK